MKSVAYRRKREGKTDYNMRLKLLLADKPRLIVRKSNKTILIQLVKYEPKGDLILVTIRSDDLKKLGWKHNLSNIPAAYLTGYLAGKKILQKGHKEAIFDMGLQAKGLKLFAALKGAVDAGLDIPHKKDILPNDEIIKGEHIQKYAKQQGKDSTITKAFDALKEKIK